MAASTENGLAPFSNVTNASSVQSNTKTNTNKSNDKSVGSREKASAELTNLASLLCSAAVLSLEGVNKDTWLAFLSQDDKKSLFCYWQASEKDLLLSLVEVPHLRFAFALIKTGMTLDSAQPLLSQSQLLHLGHAHSSGGEEHAQAVTYLVETALKQLALISFPYIEVHLRSAHAAILGEQKRLFNGAIDFFYEAKTIAELSADSFSKIFGVMKADKGLSLAEHYADVFNQLSEILFNKLVVLIQADKLLALPFSQFDQIAENARSALFSWETEWNLMRDWLNERSITPPRVSTVAQRAHLQIVRMQQLRREHERLLRAIPLVIAPTGTFNPVQSLTSAYEKLLQYSPLDLSKDSINAWHEGLAVYESAVERLESQLGNRLLLDAADQSSTGSIDDLFAFFGRVSPLLHRPRIQRALQRHQILLVESVSRSLSELKEAVKATDPLQLSLFRHLPGVAARIAYCKMIDEKAQELEKALNSALGLHWAKLPRGPELQVEIEAFRASLKGDTIFKGWDAEMKSRDFKVAGSILIIAKKEGHQVLAVNFDSDIDLVYQEVQALEDLGFHASFNLVLNATRGHTFEALAAQLTATLELFSTTTSKLTPAISSLFEGTKADIEIQLDRGINLKWSSTTDVEKYVAHTSALVASFKTSVDAAIAVSAQIAARIAALQSCSFSVADLQSEIEALNSLCATLNFGYFKDLKIFVTDLNGSIEKILLARLTEALSSFANRVESPSSPQMFVNHSVLIANDEVNVSPALTGSTLYDQLNELINIANSVSRVECPKATKLDKAPSSDAALSSDKFSTLQESLPAGLVENIRESIRSRVTSANAFVDQWIAHFDYWKTGPSRFAELPSDLLVWKAEVQTLHKTKGSLSDASSVKSFGAIQINYAQVKDDVKGKCDYWHGEMRSLFAQRLSAAVLDFSAYSENLTKQLSPALDESLPFDAANTVALVKKCTSEVPSKKEQMTVFDACEKELKSQLFQFPAAWISFATLSQTWANYSAVLDTKKAECEKLHPRLQAITAEKLTTHESKVRQLADDWSSDKPKSTETNYIAALDLLNIFKGRVNRLLEENEQVATAQRILMVQSEGLNPVDTLRSLGTEIQQQQRIWQQLSVTWITINDLRALPWTAVNAKRVRTSLEELLQEIKKLPQEIQRYEPFINCQRKLRFYLESNQVVADLRSSSVRDRHWNELQRRLRVEWNIAALTLGQVWDADIPKYKAVFAEVITACQGELALEEYLKQSSSYWNNLAFDLVQYQTKCKLVRGWEALFSKLSEDTTNLTHMKLSPFYKAFQEQATSWEARLGEANALLNMWIEIQRRWVYLEGVFESSADIKQLLPRESTWFEEANNTFVRFMRTVEDNPLVMDALGTPDLLQSFQRLSDLLVQIQKALGEYLERQRAAFPRFYFVGDEDLLDIVGSGQDPRKIQKHVKKMFVGISQFTLAEEGAVITGMFSPEGEQVPFQRQILPKIFKRLDAYLSRIEGEMKSTLAILCQNALAELKSAVLYKKSAESSSLWKWIENYPAQIVVLSAQIAWTTAVEESIKTKNLAETVTKIEELLSVLSARVSSDLSALLRKKSEHLITELVHQRDITRKLAKANVDSPTDFTWLAEMRFYHTSEVTDAHKQVTVQMANASFEYGFEYLGVPERLVQTPLTDRVFLTLTQALNNRMGGNPFGPAGTGKTETVKALSQLLGRHIVVFGCDETFDYQAMSRILVGLSQCGAWGCFDEFNRLEERILSAVSQQIQLIQESLRGNVAELTLAGKRFRLNPQTGIFVTLNPTYAGRSNLPDNLKQLFRGVAMFAPDRELIAQVMLYSHGFMSAEAIARKVVPLFKLCSEQLSSQSHYDFGLRALKSVLVAAGATKRRLSMASLKIEEPVAYEKELILRSLAQTVTPTLVLEDLALFSGLAKDIFQTENVAVTEAEELVVAAKAICTKKHLVPAELFLEKLVQLYRVQSSRHGVMLVGPSATGKSTVWRTLLEALEVTTAQKTKSYVIDPKAISKEQLFGVLDATTREWKDGIFTSILRAIQSNLRGERDQLHFIVFDGDVDPDWVENLNALLDDNKLLTLPSGERIALADSVRVVFEVDSLRHATPATVSRCGMIWFSEDTLSFDMVSQSFLSALKQQPIIPAKSTPSSIKIQEKCVELIEPFFGEGGFISRALLSALNGQHVMALSRPSALNTLFAMLKKSVAELIEFDPSGLSVSATSMTQFIVNRVVFSTLWAFGGGMNIKARTAFAATLLIFLEDSSQFPTNLVDFEVSLKQGGSWVPWASSVPKATIDETQVASPDVVVPTIDTVRHVDIVRGLLKERKPLILCGPPGSGKTMTLSSTLKSLPEYLFAELSLSSASTPSILLKALTQHCEVARGPSGDFIMRPKQVGKWLVFFLDEINLPAPDSYGTQRVISFVRQLIEHGGYWRSSDHAWVSLERIQFVGACNPPTDAGRSPLPSRFMRHAPILYVDFPSLEALQQIYGCFVEALLRPYSSLRDSSAALVSAMIDVFTSAQRKFTVDMHAHYVYSPRDLSRWLRAIRDSLKKKSDISEKHLAQLWMHEGLRIFQDRLVDKSEREWTDNEFDTMAKKYFPDVLSTAFTRPLLFTDWLTHEYESANRDDVRTYIQGRLDRFNEEELDVPLVLFSEVIDHMLRIDRVLKQPQGHVLLIGASGSGKSLLSRFVAWQNGHSIFTIKVNGRYSAHDFDEDLKIVMRRCGVDNEKISFIFDESNVLESAFLERMNALLASGEIPGLFEGQELTALLNSIKATSQRRGIAVQSDDEAYRLFVSQVRQNLHIVFTMNPSSPDFHNRALTSPALFNRCTIDWFGDWSDSALYQVGAHFTQNIDFEMNKEDSHEGPLLTDSVLSALVYIHQSVEAANLKLKKESNLFSYVTPRHYLDFISHLSAMINKKREELTQQQSHLSVGLEKLHETAIEVKALQEILEVKSAQLQEKKSSADEKLRKLTEDKLAAEAKRKEATELQLRLEQQTIEIEQKKFKAQTELAVAKPALAEAKKAVTGIQKKYLDEIKALKRPPQLVQEILEAVCFLLGAEKKLVWSKILQKFSDRDFIPSIINFKTKSITDTVRQTVQSQYLSQSGFTFEAIDYASKACGPLYKWLHAHCNYSEIKNRVKPLKAKIAELSVEAEKTKTQLTEVTSALTALESEVAKLSEEHLVLVANCDAIEAELSVVVTKVRRSNGLLQNLSKERERWNEVSQSFADAMKNVVGNAVLCAAFIAYCGFYDQSYRAQLISSWKAYLRNLALPFSPELSVVEYLTSPDERFTWRANKLTADEIAEENATILSGYNRYPLVIDPSGQATEFLMAQFAERKISKTSFLAPSFLKDLEAALRFGTALLVEDVESIDPVLNPVLNREVRKTGGRILIRVGDQDMDMSPSFTLFLSTRDPRAHFTPDLCSRVTFVNFTVTPTSLRAQCLDHVIRYEEPELHKQRQELKRLQSEYNRQLRRLEKSLLLTLSKCSGKLLDSDEVLTALEQLQSDATELKQKAKETDEIAKNATDLALVYAPIAGACSKIYFTLEGLPQIHFLYQFSLKFFLDLFFKLLGKGAEFKGASAEKSHRVQELLGNLFSTVNRRVTRSLLQGTRLAFSLKLAQIRLEESAAPMEEPILDELLAIVPSEPCKDKLAAAFLNEEQQINLRRLCTKMPSLLPQLTASFAKFGADWKDSAKSGSIPTSFAAQFPRGSLIPLAVLKAIAAQRFSSGAHAYLSELFGASFFPEEENLSAVVLAKSSARTPILLCSVAGFDQSQRVDEMAGTVGIKKYKSVALGTKEAFGMASSAIEQAAQTGGWVLLMNVHLVPQWLNQLEKRLHSLNPHVEFRLFLTAEINAALPATLLRASDVFVFEAPHGLQANLLHSFAEMSAARFEKAPAVRGRLQFLALWLHAVLQERLRYVPLGWSKALEFTETDKRAALEAVDYWLDQSQASADPTAALSALRVLLCDAIYGSRLESALDRRILSELVERLFSPEALKEDFAVARDASASFTLPKASTVEEYRAWLAKLPLATPPSWLALPDAASERLLIDQTASCLSNWRAMSSLSASPRSPQSPSSEPLRSSHTLAKTSASKLLAALPTLKPIAASSAVTADPLKAYCTRECSTGMTWLSKVRAEAEEVIKVVEGNAKPTFDLRATIASLSQGSAPKAWQIASTSSATVFFEVFLADAIGRVSELERLSAHLASDSLSSYLTEGVNISRLACPEAFLTATRQLTARNTPGASLESLRLKLAQTVPKGALCFVLKDLRLHCAALDKASLTRLSSGASSLVASAKLIWVDVTATTKANPKATPAIGIPLYLDEKRSSLLSTVQLGLDETLSPSEVLTSGVAFTSQ